MGNAVYFAHKINISLSVHCTHSMTQELLSWLSNNTIWYGIKHELGESEKVHIHGGCVFEILHGTGSLTGGARACCSVKQSMKILPSIKAVIDNQQYTDKTVVVTPMDSDHWFATYMQKEGELIYSKLPKDMIECKPYFADLNKVKCQNPEYEKWLKMYENDKRPVPCTIEDVWLFFGEHMYKMNDNKEQIKIVSDNKKLMDRCRSMKAFINFEVPEMPVSGKKRDNESMGSARFCPRCIENDYDSPNILEPRKQYCDRCRNY